MELVPFQTIACIFVLEALCHRCGHRNGQYINLFHVCNKGYNVDSDNKILPENKEISGFLAFMIILIPAPLEGSKPFGNS